MDRFERIAADAISEAEDVDCSLETFAEGLHDMEIAIRERRELADAEVRANEEDGA